MVSRISSVNSMKLFPHVINASFLGVAFGDPPLSVTGWQPGWVGSLPLHLLMQKMLQSNWINWYQHNGETGFCFWYNVVGVGRHSIFHYLTTKKIRNMFLYACMLKTIRKYNYANYHNSWTWIKGILGGFPYNHHHLGWPRLRSL